MGVVFEAEHKLLQKRVALKMLHADKVTDRQFSARFKREAEISSQLRNPHVVDISDVGQTEQGDLYIVMEFLEGKDLGHYLDEHHKLSQAEARHILLQATTALAAAHSVNIVHRDLKPDNIFLIQRDGDPFFVKLLDFGIAKVDTMNTGTALTKAGMLLGTPEYMSPEQCEGRPVDTRSDIYAIGVIAYQLLTGRVPFTDEHFGRILVMHSSEAPTPPRHVSPDVTPEAEETILRCLRKRREERFQTMAELHASIAAWSVRAAPEPERTMIGENLFTTRPGHAPTPVSSAQPTLSLDLTMPELDDEDAPTNAGDEVLNLGNSMITGTLPNEDDDDDLNASTVPDESAFGNAQTVAPGALQRPARPAAKPPVSLASEATRMLPDPASTARPQNPEEKLISTTAIPRVRANQPAPAAASAPVIRVAAPKPAPLAAPPAEDAGTSRLLVIGVSALVVVAVSLGVYFFALRGPAPAPPPVVSAPSAPK
jgi:serine/threonine protein kinase